MKQTKALPQAPPLPRRCECGGRMLYDYSLGRIWSCCDTCSPEVQLRIRHAAHILQDPTTKVICIFCHQQAARKTAILHKPSCPVVTTGQVKTTTKRKRKKATTEHESQRRP